MCVWDGASCTCAAPRYVRFDTTGTLAGKNVRLRRQRSRVTNALCRRRRRRRGPKIRRRRRRWNGRAARRGGDERTPHTHTNARERTVSNDLRRFSVGATARRGAGGGARGGGAAASVAAGGRRPRGSLCATPLYRRGKTARPPPRSSAVACPLLAPPPPPPTIGRLTRTVGSLPLRFGVRVLFAAASRGRTIIIIIIPNVYNTVCIQGEQ